MKKTILSTIAIILSLTGLSQNITFSMGEKGNRAGYDPTTIIVDKAISPGNYYSVEPNYSIFRKTKGIMVREVTKDFSELHRVDIPNTKEDEIYHVHRNGNQMNILIIHCDKKQYSLRHVAVDLLSFTITSDSLIIDKKIGKKVYPYDWLAISPSGNYLAYIYAFVDEKNDQSEVLAMVFDRSMKRRWQRFLPVRTISQILVTDDGRLATAGHLNDIDNNTAVIEASISDSLNTRNAFFSTKNVIGQLSLLNVYGDKLLMSALECDKGIGWAGGFLSGFVVTHGAVYTGFSTYLFDIGDSRVAGTESHTFDKEDARVFYNESIMSRIISDDINLLSARAQLPLTNGGAVLYGRTWKEKTTRTSTGATSSTYHYMGMLLVKVDSTAHIVWTRPIMHSNGINADFSESAETDIVSVDNDIILITNESASEPKTYEPNQAATGAFLISHGAIAAYRFSPEGNVTKKMLIDEGTNMIKTRLRLQDDGDFTFIASKALGRIAELSIK